MLEMRNANTHVLSLLGFLGLELCASVPFRGVVSSAPSAGLFLSLGKSSPRKSDTITDAWEGVVGCNVVYLAGVEDPMGSGRVWW